MNRIDFLKIFWKKAVIPLLIGLAIYFCINFIYQLAIFENSQPKLMLLFISLSLFVFLFLFIRTLFSNIFTEIKKRFPRFFLTRIAILNKLLNILSPFLMGIAAYYLWQNGNRFQALLVIFIIFLSLRESFINRNSSIQ